jgi:Zn-dependent protease/CBS domain-containing protein
VIAWLLTWSLAVTVFPELVDEVSPVAAWVAGVVTSAAFLASLVAHEVSHSVVAQRAGITVESITLWMLGGIARIDEEPQDANTELRIALAGPATSAALGVVFLFAASSARSFGAPALVQAALAWLGSVNLVLAVFNLVPAAPLDGGRILKAFLWRRHGDRLGAGISAARAGVTFAYVLVALGLVQVALGAFVGGIWFAFLGLFVMHAARAEEHAYRLRADLTGVRVGDVMTPRPVVAPAGVTVQDLLDDYVLQSPASSFPLVDDDGGVVGLCTLHRIRSVPAAARRRLRATDACWRLDDVPIAAPDDALVDALLTDRPGGDGRVLVFDDDRLVGIVSPSDVSRAARHGELVRSLGR